jgi:hypothetical protein
MAREDCPYHSTKGEFMSAFDHKHYVPILGGKAGEYRALRELTPEIKQRLTPLIEIPPVPWDFENDQPACTVDTHIQGTAKTIADHWGTDAAIFVDMYTLEDESNMAGGEHPLTYLFNDARGRGLQLIPVTGIDREDDYRDAVRDAAAADGRGACIRITIEDIANDPDIGLSLQNLLNALHLTRDKTDLLLDLGPLIPAHQTTYVLTARNAISTLPHIEQWRTFILAGGAFPTDTTGFDRDAVSLAPRTEWRVWSSLAATRASLRRMPTFSDYSVDAPGHEQLDFRIIKMNAHIRYTHTDNWVVVKGHVIRKGAPTQYPGLAAILYARPEYSGAEFSWGDNYIQECDLGHDGPGNATTWRQVGVNHHSTFVVNQIASFPGL